MIATTGARTTARWLSRSACAALVCQSNAAATRTFASTSQVRLDAPAPASASGPGPSSVHASEIEHFSRLSSQWWDEHGEFGLLHAMNPARIQFLREKLDEVWGYEVAKQQVEARRSGTRTPPPPASGEVARAPLENVGKTQFLAGLDVADIGCGGGLLSESLARLGARTTGVDASSSNIGIATTHAARDPLLSREHALGGPALSYLHATAEDLVAQNRTFDVVCAMEVLEHVNGPADFLRSLDRLVKPGGHLFMSTIARTKLSWFLTIFMAEDVLRLVTPGTHTHHQYINPKELVDFVQNDLKWYGNAQSNLPQRLHFETRGTAYLPWKGTWTLAPSGTSLPGTQECNYFFWARKPLHV